MKHRTSIATQSASLEPEPGGAGMSESEKASEPGEVHGPGLRAGGGRRKARASAGTEFRGVCWRPGGKFGARIRESKGKAQTWLGTFDTADDAAKAFDAAAARMHGAAARTNFKQPATVDDGGVSSLLHAPAEPSGHDGRTKFLGVCRQPGGKFGARIRDSKAKGKAQTWLGTFDTADDAAKAFDAAAARMHGAAARTNFKQPATVNDGGVSSLLHAPAEPSGHDGRTKFLGVCRQPGGKFGARIRDSKGKSPTWLGTFDTAEDAARAFDAAAARMHGAAARTNFKEPAAIDDGGVSLLIHVPAELSSQNARTEFRGVCRRPSGKFRARISKGKAETWLGTFDTAEEAARAFDAAAVKMRGAATRTNFKQPTAIDDGVSPLLAEPSGQCVHRQPSGEYNSQTCDWKGKAALSLGGFDSPGLPPAEWQQVEELLKYMDSSDDREALIEAAAILRHISLAGHGDGGALGQNDDDDDDIPNS